MKGRFRILIASTGLLLIAASSARAQTTARETGSVTVGGYLLWVRGTNANLVELYVGRGFRDAFAKSHDMDAARVQQWIDSVRAARPVPAEDSIVGDSQLGGSALGADVTMLRRIGGAFSGLRVIVNGEDPIRMAESTARDFIAMLDSAVRVTRELSPPPRVVLASAPAQSAPAPIAAMPAAQPIAAMPAAQPIAAMPAPPPSTTTPAAPPIAVTAAAPRVSAPAPAPAPAPAVVAQAPSQPVAMPRATSVVMPAPVRTVVSSAAPTVAANAAATITPVAVAQVATMPPVAAAARDSIVPRLAAEPSDKLIRTPLGPFTVPAALLSDRDKEAQYCYRQLGLKYTPDLKGEITVRLSLGTDGAVHDAVVTKRSWQGISAGEVESCVRALAHDWTFASTDPAVSSGAKVVTFSFAP
ncbi:MAG: hypothetical protein ACM34L_16450 [Gemmatimonas sp.]|nr:hypothetical protein [Gemmatimonadaceae bacterium]